MYIIHERLYAFSSFLTPNTYAKKNPDLPGQIRVDEK
jgi:hypothetical protein